MGDPEGKPTITPPAPPQVYSCNLHPSVGTARALAVAFVPALSQGLGKGMGNGKRRSNVDGNNGRLEELHKSFHGAAM